jgi:hypothetical protein
MDVETGHHAIMDCIVAKALRQELRQVWSLPSDYAMRYTGKDGVLVLLDILNEDMKAKVMFSCWRAWHHRNDCIFGKGDASISHSAIFVKNYHDSI